MEAPQLHLLDSTILPRTRCSLSAPLCPGKSHRRTVCTRPSHLVASTHQCTCPLHTASAWWIPLVQTSQRRQSRIGYRLPGWWQWSTSLEGMEALRLSQLDSTIPRHTRRSLSAPPCPDTFHRRTVCTHPSPLVASTHQCMCPLHTASAWWIPLVQTSQRRQSRIGYRLPGWWQWSTSLERMEALQLHLVDSTILHRTHRSLSDPPCPDTFHRRMACMPAAQAGR